MKYPVKPKKHLGQHFLIDQNIAKQIADCVLVPENQLPAKLNCLEIGSGTGVLTQFLLQKPELNLIAIEIDNESIQYLKKNFPNLHLLNSDFLQLPLSENFGTNLIITGNFPYNISSQIFFKILESKDNVSQIVCMLQKEVAERIASKPGKKSYGILSVFLQAYYRIEYLFTVHENVFLPPPKVKSGVIRLMRNNVEKLNCNEDLFVKIVKASFNQRRKTLRNSLKGLSQNCDTSAEIFNKRPEQLSVDEFVLITNLFEI